MKTYTSSSSSVADGVGRLFFFLSFLVAGFFLPARILAADLFSYSISSSDVGAPAPIYISASSLNAILVYDIDTAELSFVGYNFAETLTLYGYKNALNFTSNSAQTLITLTSPLTGLNRTFGSESLYSDYVDSQQAIDDMTALIKALFKVSPVTNADGSPSSKTATSSQTVFEQFGFGDVASAITDFAAGDSAGNSVKSSGSGLYFDQTHFNVKSPGGDTMNGQNAKLVAPYTLGLGNNVAVKVGVSIGYTEIDDFKNYDLSLYAGVPIKFIRFKPASKWQWQVSPFVGAVAGAAEDGSAASFNSFVGATNLVEYKITPDIIVSVASQFTDYEPINLDSLYQGLKVIDADSYIIQVKQQIVKNGARVRWRLAPRWIAEGFAIDTRFLKTAAIDHYETIGGGISFKLSQRWSVGLNSKYEFASNYTGWNVGFSSGFSF